MLRPVFLFKLLVVLVLLPVSVAIHANVVRVAAASSLQFALNEVVEAYVKDTGRTAPQIVYGSSGNLYRQILQGAPFELFFSARSELTRQLTEKYKAEQNSGIDGSDLLGTGRLVLLSASPFTVDAGLSDFIQKKIIDRKVKFAIANPAHAPYGRAAKEVLQSLQLWQAVQPGLINGEQVSQATRFVVSGASPFGLVSLSLALSPTIANTTHYQLIDRDLHQPIEHTMLRLNAASTAAKDFYQFVLNSERSDEILRRYGFR